MKTKQYVKSMVLTLTVTGLCMQSLAGAQTNQKIQPAYTNSAEVRQAVHLALQDANTTNPSLRESLTHLNEVESQMDHNQMFGNQQKQISTATALTAAENHYVSILTGMTGVSEKDIRNMHTSGVDWSNVPRELGLHMGTGQMTESTGQGTMQQGNMGTDQMTGNTGQGTMQQGNMGTGQMNSAGSRNAEIMAATARNTESGWAEGHGTGMQTDVHGNEGGGMMSGAGGLGNGIASDEGGHDGNMGGGMGSGMGADNSGSGAGGSGSSGGMGGGMGGGGSSSGGGSGGHGGGMM